MTGSGARSGPIRTRRRITPSSPPSSWSRWPSHPKVVGIGETGLDFHYDLSPRDIQERVFRAHIAASRTSGLPLIIHAREADREIARILDEERPPPGVLHCFSSGRALAENGARAGILTSRSPGS